MLHRNRDACTDIILRAVFQMKITEEYAIYRKNFRKAQNLLS